MACVNSFVDFISARYSPTAHIYCLCNLCCNQHHRPQRLVREHLLMNGIASTYSRWIYHKEDADAVIIEGDVGVHSPFNARLDDLLADQEASAKWVRKWKWKQR